MYKVQSLLQIESPFFALVGCGIPEWCWFSFKSGLLPDHHGWGERLWCQSEAGVHDMDSLWRQWSSASITSHPSVTGCCAIWSDGTQVDSQFGAPEVSNFQLQGGWDFWCQSWKMIGTAWFLMTILGQRPKKYDVWFSKWPFFNTTVLFASEPWGWQVVGSNITACLKDLDRFGYSERIEKDAQVGFKLDPLRERETTKQS